MKFAPKLTKGQYRYFAAAIKTISEGIILGGSVAFFLPETFQLREGISLDRYLILFITGLILLLFGAILERKGEEK